MSSCAITGFSTAGIRASDLSGEYATIQTNFNYRYYLGYVLPPAPYPNPAGLITTVLEGFHVQDPSDGETASDYMSRGYDLGGRNLWVSQCAVVNTGSLGNDGEGVMSQQLNNIDVYPGRSPIAGSSRPTTAPAPAENSGPGSADGARTSMAFSCCVTLTTTGLAMPATGTCST